MKFQIIVLAATSVLFAQLSFAQQSQNFPIPVKWSDDPQIHQTDQRYKNEPAIILSDARRIEYIDQGETLAEYRTVHKLVRINDDNGIKAFNTIYLDVFDNEDIRDIRARTILPGGKIIEVDRKNIKDVQEKERWYKIFALEGVEKGCEIEYYYTYKVSFSYFGRETLQGPFPVMASLVEVVAPERLIFDVKNYNGTNTVTDTILSGKKIVSLKQHDISPVIEEKYSAYSAMLNRIEYKLSYNTARNADVRLFTWAEMAKLVHSSYSTLTSNEQRKVAELIKKEGWEKINDDEEKIVQVEKFIKTFFSNRNDISGENAENMEKVIKNKIASNKGIVRLYSAIFTKLGVKHEYVLSGSRDSYELDKNFENWDNAENPLIYFSDLQKYICPTLVEMRYPWIHPLWSSTNALFCKPTTIGNFSTAIGIIKDIPIQNYEATQNNIDAEIGFNTGIDTLIISAVNSLTGYSSAYMRTSYNFSSKEEQEAMTKDMAKSGTGSEHIISSAFKNTEFENLRYNQPFIFDAKVKSVELVERAGNKILVKLGEMIGQQAEIYEDKPRQMPIHINYPHIMKRKIIFKIPEGYEALNPEVFRIRSVYEDKGERTMGFEADYNLSNNILTINIVEDYRKVWYPVDQYAAFQKIINAAADFNKAVLVIQKK